MLFWPLINLFETTGNHMISTVYAAKPTDDGLIVKGLSTLLIISRVSRIFTFKGWIRA